ncbi:hypothetical protein LEP1GSC179_4120 [Leptospira santarosai str. MOR084]|uniref:Uncharacterized protein n=1 Tax=Leptospira santarosai str. MOR084 TaxID=1049984 RepID=A0A0E2BHM5_9LEPT|nr:hypothetical protein LEP1GSC179_4120 [Leptospira santarosai str. MOR084]
MILRKIGLQRPALSKPVFRAFYPHLQAQNQNQRYLYV